jgi:hypothetical protein
MDIVQFIPENMFILIAVLYVLGMFFKGSKYMDDEAIPFALLVIGCLLSIAKIGLSVDGFMQGILCTGVAIGVNQTIKQVDKMRGK